MVYWEVRYRKGGEENWHVVEFGSLTSAESFIQLFINDCHHCTKSNITVEIWRIGPEEVKIK